MSAPVSYDDLWKTAWGSMQHVGPVHRHVREDFGRVVDSLGVETVLDVGCGSGENLAFLAAAGRYRLAGTDLSAEALALARSRLGEDVRLEILNVAEAALPETFDLVSSVQVVEHIPDDVAALRNIARMSHRYVYTSTISGRMRPSERAIGHIRNYSATELVAKHEAVGLEVVWVRGWGFPFYSPLYRTVAELLPSGPPSGDIRGAARTVSSLLYHLYRLNVPGRGDVIGVLARKPGA